MMAKNENVIRHRGEICWHSDKGTLIGTNLSMALWNRAYSHLHDYLSRKRMRIISSLSHYTSYLAFRGWASSPEQMHFCTVQQTSRGSWTMRMLTTKFNFSALASSLSPNFIATALSQSDNFVVLFLPDLSALSPSFFSDSIQNPGDEYDDASIPNPSPVISFQ